MDDSLRTRVRAMPSARATHASHRARILGLGLSVGIAIAASPAWAFPGIPIVVGHVAPIHHSEASDGCMEAYWAHKYDDWYASLTPAQRSVEDRRVARLDADEQADLAKIDREFAASTKADARIWHTYAVLSFSAAALIGAFLLATMFWPEAVGNAETPSRSPGTPHG